MTHFEIVRPPIARREIKAVLFDFDGTLSLIREGWSKIMIDMMVEIIKQARTKTLPLDLEAHVEEFVMALNGRPSIFQMARLVEEIVLHDGQPLTAEEYLEEYDRRLLAVVDSRTTSLANGGSSPADWAVPGSHALLRYLQKCQLPLYLASGTQLKYVHPEATLLDLIPFFGKEINAPVGNNDSFSKRSVIERILRENNISGEQLLSFGDGVVETQEIRRVGGLAVAVASQEVGVTGLNHEKRTRLITAGADVVIADYDHPDELQAFLRIDLAM